MLRPLSKIRQDAIKAGFRSGFEKDLAASLRKSGIKFKYEQLKIKWIDPSEKTYTPDFVLGNGVIIEAKGRLTTSDRKKHKLIQKLHGGLYDIRFVFQNPYAKLRKGSKTTYAKWADQHGFLWADRVIPKEWTEEQK